MPKNGGKSLGIGILGGSCNQCVQVIRHEAVGDYLNLVCGRSTQKLTQSNVNDLRRLKICASAMGAHRQEDAVSAHVEGIGQFRRSSMLHTLDGFKKYAARMPLHARLKPSRSHALPTSG